MSRRERLALVIVLAGLVCGLALCAVLTWLMWPVCNPSRDGAFYGKRDGSVQQCVCKRGASGWACKLEER